MTAVLHEKGQLLTPADRFNVLFVESLRQTKDIGVQINIKE